jgi:two-component system, cell cycle sensor histidine kinase and response regulator CckA
MLAVMPGRPTVAELSTLAIQAAPCGILAIDATGTIILANPELAKIFGYAVDELIGQPMARLIPERFRRSHESHHSHFAAAPSSRHLGAGRDLVGLHKDGHEIPVEIALTPVPRPEGLLVLASIIDISERRKAETQIRESEVRFRELADNVREIFFVLDPQTWRALYVSPAYESITGYTQAEAYAGPFRWADGIHPEDQERVLATTQESARTGAFATVVYRVVRPDKTIRWVRARGTPVRDGAGQVVRLVGIAEDITDLKGTEAQLVQAQKMEAVGRLAGGIAHDFNNLLTVITSYGELQLDDLPAEDARRADLEEIVRAAREAAKLTRQLLAFSRRQVLDVTVLSLNDVVTNLNKMLMRVIGEDLDLALVLAPDLGAVRADPGQIEQVLMNLAVNARDAMPNGGKITIETSNVELTEDYVRTHEPVIPGSYVLLAFSDSGLGMDEATKAHIFEPFFTTKEIGKGTGLGLATVYGIVKQSDGFIWVYSEPGHGATFKIYLPRVTEAAERLVATAPAPIRRGRETILLVEDDPAVRKVERAVLERLGYTILVADRPSVALEIAASGPPPDLLLSDVIMPEMNGRDLARQLQSKWPKLKVLYISGYTDDAVVRHGVLEAGVSFLQKPFAPEALAQKVGQVLDRKE